MTITIELAPELEAELARQAAAHGVGIDAYAASLLEEAAHSPTGFESTTVSPEVVEACERLRIFGSSMGFRLAA